ncbi:hypothetical protein R1sor_022070 [Riccia sorocarpa]|uniref:Uncharacterized protein n=1 Tax=Riccia sorocarpa TaxID=122646 RepID=A0ABD3GPM6_9MARC
MAMRDWGCKELERLCAFYGEDRTSEVLGVVPALVAPASIKGEFRTFKIQCLSDWHDNDFHHVAEIGAVCFHSNLRERF